MIKVVTKSSVVGRLVLEGANTDLMFHTLPKLQYALTASLLLKILDVRQTFHHQALTGSPHQSARLQ